ncbi:HNRPQ protein, partial [Daphoenositta chrysoptera]|nr:HNRPQ protein [Daphoenositta chrysoptera]
MATEHVNGNGTEEPMDTSAAVTHSEHFQTLLDAGLPQKVAEKLDEIYVAGKHHKFCQFKERFLCFTQSCENLIYCPVLAFPKLNIWYAAVEGERKLFVTDDRPLIFFLQYNNHEIRSGKHIGVCISVANNRLFVGSIPKSKTKEQIVEEFSKVTEGLTDVILYHQPDDKKKNRGFCFLEYEDHKTAAQARRRLMSGKVKVWGNVVTVEWADPIEDPDPEVMAKVKVLFVRNLANTVTEEILEKAFSQFGKLERVKKLKDYAFIHFDERDGAVKAMEEMNGKDLEGENIEIVFAKPPDQKRKERKAQRQAAKNQMYDDYYYYGPPHMPPPTRGRGRGGRGGYGYPPDYYGYEDYYDYYGYDYHNYRGGYEDPYYGYEDFQVGARGRGGRGARGAAPSRGRGAAPPRGRAGYAQRGGPGSARGVRGARGGAQQQRGRGVRGARGGRGGNVGGKRKADGYNQPDSKRRQTNNQNWGSQPIAQQPLQGGDHSGNYGYKSENQEFYQDSFGQQWK